MCAVPPISRDALTHHLAVPLLYVQQGGIHELPDIIASYYPQLLDLIYCIPLIFGNDIAPKYIHFAFALFTALLIFFYVQKELNRFYGLLSVLFFLSLPVIVKLSVTVYVDLGLIFFSSASLILLLKWHKKQFQFRWLFLSAVCCGLALSTKYNGLITCFLLTAFTPLLYIEVRNNSIKRNKGNGLTLLFQKKSSQIKAIGYGVCFLLISAAIFSPWMIKNYIWTQNPVYPLYDNFFNPATAGVSMDNNSGPSMNHFLTRKHIYKESWFETAIIPLRIFFQGEDNNPKFFDGKLNPLLFLLPLFAFISSNNTTTRDSIYKKMLLLFSFLYILMVFFQQDMRIRWIGPAIPPLVILSAHGLKNLFQYITPNKTVKPKNAFNFVQFQKSFLFILIFLVVSLNVVYIYQLFKKIAPQTYITHQVTRSEYIEKFRPEYAALQFANDYLKGDVKLLAFFLGDRRYYSDHDIRFNNSQFKHLVQNSKTARGIFQGLKKQNYTNLIINYPEFNFWNGRIFNIDEQGRIQEFFNYHTKRLFSKGGHGLYQLIPSQEHLSRQ